MIPGFLVGELVWIIALFSMLPSRETAKKPEPLRTALGGLHGLATLVGVEIALAELSAAPTWLAMVFRAGNVFNFAVAAVMIAMVFPERTERGSTRKMWEMTFGPVVAVVIWSLVSTWILGHDASLTGRLERSALLLSLHYVFVTGGIIFLLLFDPPPQSPAAQLELRERLKSGMGVIWLTLVGLWMAQAIFALITHWRAVFGDSLLSALFGLGLSAAGVYRTARIGHQKSHHAQDHLNDSPPEDSDDELDDDD